MAGADGRVILRIGGYSMTSRLWRIMNGWVVVCKEYQNAYGQRGGCGLIAGAVGVWVMQ